MSLLRGMSKAVFAAGDRFVRSPAGPRILIYHQVGTSHGHQMEVTKEAFAEQLAWLATECEVVELTTALKRWEEPGSERLAVLTFDDGYRDVYTTAFPMLADREMPFLLYISTGLVGQAAGEMRSEEALDWPDISAMVDSGLLTVGAHTHSHPDLRSLSSDEVSKELETSDQIIFERLGASPRHFAYPYGFWSATADELVRGRYETAVLGGSPSPSAHPDAHLLHRYPVQLSDGFTWFKQRMSGGFRLEEALRKRLKGYEGP
ncbi:MAG TPA: polysaccharide deacetylase family protein [Acidimicrobiia bacterium]|nr:polysaccharide deacetylase family protein [Acidimicrobiia bacterium]